MWEPFSPQVTKKSISSQFDQTSMEWSFLATMGPKSFISQLLVKIGPRNICRSFLFKWGAKSLLCQNTSRIQFVVCVGQIRSLSICWIMIG